MQKKLAFTFLSIFFSSIIFASPEAHARKIRYIKEGYSARRPVQTFNTEETKQKKEDQEIIKEEEILTAKDKQLKSVSLISQDPSNIKYEGDTVVYNSETEEFIIEGAAVLYLEKDGVKISADRIDYSPDTSKLKAYGNVLISGKEQVTFAEYMEIELNNNKADLTEVNSYLEQASVKAKDSKLYISNNRRQGQYRVGEFKLAKPARFGSNIAGLPSERFNRNLTGSSEELLAKGQSFTLSANKVSYHPDRIQNNLFISGGKLKFKKFPLVIPIPFYVLTVGESTQQMFTPVLGNVPNTGAGDFNIGPKFSFVLGDPKKRRAFSFAPVGQLGSAAGYGGFVEYTDPRISALLGYGAAKDRGLSEVEVKVTKHNNLLYGWNSYMGGGITEQFVQFNDERRLKLPVLTSIFEGNQINLRTDLTYVKDSDTLRNEENNRLSDLQSDSFDGNSQQIRNRDGVRFQHQISMATKPLLEVGTDNYNASFRIISSSTARIYSSGNLNGFITIGPNFKIHAHKYADLQVGYDQLLPAGKSPFGFDQVIQGNESIYGAGDVNLASWLSVGSAARYSISRSTFTEQLIRFIVGPEDFKLIAAYDPVRRRFNVGFSLLFDDKVKFNRLTYSERTSGKKRRF
ncbi:MAG TPA: hypothetical protein V6C96_02640 [Vampirovibrionales bacterium]